MHNIFETKNLHKSFGGLVVADNINLSIKKGERVALIGPNGAGKTTFVNLVTGHTTSDAGHIYLNGEDISQDRIEKRVKKGLLRTFQISRLFNSLTVEEHIAIALLQKSGKIGQFFGDYHHLPIIMSEVAAILNIIGLKDLAKIEIENLAYGQQRLLEIGIVLAMQPKILLLDEPAAGVAQSEICHIEQALHSLPNDLSILMIDHDMDLVFRFAKRVIVLTAGAVIFDGAPKDAINNQHVRLAYLGNYAI